MVWMYVMRRNSLESGVNVDRWGKVMIIKHRGRIDETKMNVGKKGMCWQMVEEKIYEGLGEGGQLNSITQK